MRKWLLLTSLFYPFPKFQPAQRFISLPYITDGLAREWINNFRAKILQQIVSKWCLKHMWKKVLPFTTLPFLKAQLSTHIYNMQMNPRKPFHSTENSTVKNGPITTCKNTSYCLLVQSAHALYWCIVGWFSLAGKSAWFWTTRCPQSGVNWVSLLRSFYGILAWKGRLF